MNLDRFYIQEKCNLMLYKARVGIQKTSYELLTIVILVGVPYHLSNLNFSVSTFCLQAHLQLQICHKNFQQNLLRLCHFAQCLHLPWLSWGTTKQIGLVLFVLHPPKRPTQVLPEGNVTPMFAMKTTSDSVILPSVCACLAYFW